MTPKPNRKQITSWLTPGQLTALKRAVGLTGVSQSDFIRAALGETVKAWGLEWPDDMPKRGTYEREQPPK
jgi:hypothetical protein